MAEPITSEFVRNLVADFKKHAHEMHAVINTNTDETSSVIELYVPYTDLQKYKADLQKQNPKNVQDLPKDPAKALEILKIEAFDMAVARQAGIKAVPEADLFSENNGPVWLGMYANSDNGANFFGHSILRDQPQKILLPRRFAKSVEKVGNMNETELTAFTAQVNQMYNTLKLQYSLDTTEKPEPHWSNPRHRTMHNTDHNTDHDLYYLSDAELPSAAPLPAQKVSKGKTLG